MTKQILAMLDPEGTNQITARMIMQNGDEAFEKFNKGFIHDPTIENLWYKLFAAKGIFQEFGVMHFNTPEEDLTKAVEEKCERSGKIEQGEIVYVEELDSMPVCDDKKLQAKEEEGRNEELNQVEEEEKEHNVDGEEDKHDEL